MKTAAKKNPGTQAPSEEELIARASALIPMLRAQAMEVENARSVPAQTIDAFREAGFFKILQPARWGGWEMHPRTFYKVLMELGRGCPSSAWNAMILGIHQWHFGVMDPRAGDDMWSEDPNILVGSSYAPLGQIKKVEGGWRLSGTWKTSSGCDHAAGGSFLGGRVLDGDGNMIDHRAFLVSRKDYEIVDDWHVAGLGGTGSKSLAVRQAFVPDYRVHSIIDYKLTDRPAAYLYPFMQTFGGAVSAAIIGIAYGMIDLYVEQMKTRQNVFGPAGPAAANPYVKDNLGKAVIQVRSAQARLLQATQETAAYAMRGEQVPLDKRVLHRLENQYCGRDCLEAALLLWRKMGTRGIWLDNLAQLWMRAILVATNHISQNEDDPAGILGGYMLGEEVPPLMFNLPETP